MKYKLTDDEFQLHMDEILDELDFKKYASILEHLGCGKESPDNAHAHTREARALLRRWMREIHSIKPDDYYQISSMGWTVEYISPDDVNDEPYFKARWSPLEADTQYIESEYAERGVINEL